MVGADEHEDGPTGHNAVKEADTLDPLPHPELLYNAWAEEEHDPFVGPVISDWLQYAPTESLKSAPTSQYLGGQDGDFTCDFSDLNNEGVFDFDAYVGQAEHTANQVRRLSVNNAYHGNYYGTTSLHDNAKAQFGDTYQTTIIATTTSSSSSSCMALAANLVGGAAGGFAFAAANTYYSNDASGKDQTTSCSEDKVRATASVGSEKTAVPTMQKGILFEGTDVTSTSRQDPTSTFEWDPTPLPPPAGIVPPPTNSTGGNSSVQNTLYKSALLKSEMMAGYRVSSQHSLKMQQHCQLGRPQSASSPEHAAKQNEYLQSSRLLEETNSLPIPSQYQKCFVDSVLKGTGLYGLPPSTWGDLKIFLLSRTGGMHKTSNVRKVQLDFAKEREAAKSSHSANISPLTARKEDGARLAPPITGNEQEILNSSSQESGPHAAVSTTGSVLASTSELDDDTDDSTASIPTDGGRSTSWSTTTRYLTGNTTPHCGHMALKRKRTGSDDDGGQASCKSTI